MHEVEIGAFFYSQTLNSPKPRIRMQIDADLKPLSF